MEKRLTENTRYPKVTEKMDTALRNMWNGLKRWDRDNECIDDMFDDLEAVEGEMADLDASGENTAPKGRETSDTSNDLMAKHADALKSKRFPSGAPNEANKPKAEAPLTRDDLDRGPGPVIGLAEALRRKEAAVGFVLEQIHEAPITVLDKKTLRNLAVADVLGMTKSDRNQQLIRSAYYIGVLRGIGLLHGKLQDDG
jgi:hypothetical protein